MKRLIKKISILTACACLAGMVFVQPAFAAGGAYVSNTTIDVVEGETIYIAVGTENAAGSYVVTSSGGASANDSGWLDNQSAAVGIYGATVGSGVVTIKFDSLATYDYEELDGTTMDIYVNVIPAETQTQPDRGEEQTTTQPETTTAPPETTTTAPPETTTTAAPTTTATTAANKLQATYNGASCTVQSSLSGIELPAGFKEADGTYNGEKVRVLKFNDEITLYVLRSDADGKVYFLTYDEKSKQFTAPKTVVNDQKTYYLLDIPDSVQIPDTYEKKAVKIDNYEVQGIVSKDSDKQDLSYIRAMENGTAGYYSYNGKPSSLQRVPELDKVLSEASKSSADSEKTGLSKPVLIAIIAGGVIILGLIILMIILLVRKRRKNNDVYFDDDDYYYPDSYFTDGEDEDEDYESDINWDDFDSDFDDDDDPTDNTRDFSRSGRDR